MSKTVEKSHSLLIGTGWLPYMLIVIVNAKIGGCQRRYFLHWQFINWLLC